MSIVRVSGNSYLNPVHVGKVELSVDFDTNKGTRTKKTTIWDSTGINIMLEVKTTIDTRNENTDKDIAVRTDNALHSEIVAAIKNGVDARSYDELRVLASNPKD